MEIVGEPNMVGRDGSVPIMVCLVLLINKDPLHNFTHTMKVCYLNCIRILLEYGANPNTSSTNRAHLTPLHILVFAVSENLTLSCDEQKQINFEFIKNLLVLLLTHGLNTNFRINSRNEHILQMCMEMIHNVRDCRDIKYVHDLTLTLVQYGANADLHLNMTEPISNPLQRSQSIWKSKNYILYYYIMLVSKEKKVSYFPQLFIMS